MCPCTVPRLSQDHSSWRRAADGIGEASKEVGGSPGLEAHFSTCVLYDSTLLLAVAEPRAQFSTQLITCTERSYQLLSGLLLGLVLFLRSRLPEYGLLSGFSPHSEVQPPPLGLTSFWRLTLCPEFGPSGSGVLANAAMNGSKKRHITSQRLVIRMGAPHLPTV